jgi:DNA-binding NarL/FixJ family response regulator
LENPFAFINDSVNVLIADDDPNSVELLRDIFALAPIYVVHSVFSSTEALSLLRSGKRFHVLILDLGLNDVENDEFYLLRQYAHHSSVIILTGSDSPTKGAMCIQMGARSVIEKGARFNIRKFFETVNCTSIINIVNARYSDSSAETLNFATKVLIEKMPKSVTEWADCMRITDRQLRNLWHTGLGYSAKQVLALFTILTQTLRYYTVSNFGTSDEKHDFESSVDIKKLLSYYEAHKNIITFIFS